MKPKLFFDLKFFKLRTSAKRNDYRARLRHLSLELLHSDEHGINGCDGLFRGGCSELCLLRGLVDACGDGLGLLIDGALGDLEDAADELDGYLEERSVEDDLVVRHNLGRAAHLLCVFTHSQSVRLQIRACMATR
jgi:hypothetical protein